MNQKGFTLIEMLGVFTILAAILLVSIPSLIGVYKKTKENTYQRFLNNLYLATEAYVQAGNVYDLSLPNQKVYVKLEEVVKANYLKSTLLNPDTNETVNLEHYIEIAVNEDYTLNYNYVEEAPEINLTEPIYQVNPKTYTNQTVNVGITYGVEGTKLFKTTVPVTSNINVVKCGRVYNGTCNQEITKTIEAGVWYQVDGNVILTFTENGTVTAESVEGLNYESSSSMTVNNIDKKPPTVEYIKVGTDLYTDFNFSSGINSMVVYNNKANGTVTLTREAMKTPVGDYAVKVQTNGEASPSAGGFYQRTEVGPDSTYIHRIIAKIPVGYQIQYAYNQIGDSPQFEWLTSQEGTGEWEEYIYTLKTGSTGTFQNFGFVYLKSSISGGNQKVTWYVASARMIQVTSNGNTIFMYLNDENELGSYGCNGNASKEPNYTSISGKGHSAICTANTIDYGTHYIHMKDAAGNKIIEKIGYGYPGTMLFKDPTFTSGTNNAVVYNNTGNGLITIIREGMLTPFSNGNVYGLTIQKAAGEARPAHGGFMQVIQVEANHKYIHKVIAKIPEGYYLGSTGSLGLDAEPFEWLTSPKGTGKWEEYMYVVKAGTSVTTSSRIGYIFIYPEGNRTTGTLTGPAITWQVAYSTIIDWTTTGSDFIFVVQEP